MPGLISLLSGFMSESVLGDSDGCCHLLLIKYERGWPRTKAFLSRMREFQSIDDKTRTARFVKHLRLRRISLLVCDSASPWIF